MLPQTEPLRDTVQVYVADDKVDSIATALAQAGSSIPATVKIRGQLWADPTYGRAIHLSRGNLAAACVFITDVLTAGTSSRNRQGASWHLDAEQAEVFGTEIVRLEEVAAAVRINRVPDHTKLRHLESGLWMPYWLAVRWMHAEVPGAPQQALPARSPADKAMRMDVDDVVETFAEARRAGAMSAMELEGADVGVPDTSMSAPMDISIEGDARLVLIVDSCALLGRMPSIKNLGDLVRAQHGTLVEGQNLTLTVKLLIPFIATMELDRMKDDRSAKTLEVRNMARAALEDTRKLPEGPWDKDVMFQKREESMLVVEGKYGPPPYDAAHRPNNDDCLLATVAAWAEKLAGAQYSRVVLLTQDTGLLAKARHEGLHALTARELPQSAAALAKLLIDDSVLAGIAAGAGLPSGGMSGSSLPRRDSLAQRMGLQLTGLGRSEPAQSSEAVNVGQSVPQLLGTMQREWGSLQKHLQLDRGDAAQIKEHSDEVAALHKLLQSEPGNALGLTQGVWHTYNLLQALPDPTGTDLASVEAQMGLERGRGELDALYRQIEAQKSQLMGQGVPLSGAASRQRSLRASAASTPHVGGTPRAGLLGRQHSLGGSRGEEGQMPAYLAGADEAPMRRVSSIASAASVSSQEPLRALPQQQPPAALFQPTPDPRQLRGKHMAPDGKLTLAGGVPAGNPTQPTLQLQAGGFPDFNRLPPLEHRRLRLWLQRGLHAGEVSFEALQDCPPWLRLPPGEAGHLHSVHSAPQPDLRELERKLSMHQAPPPHLLANGGGGGSFPAAPMSDAEADALLAALLQSQPGLQGLQHSGAL